MTLQEKIEKVVDKYLREKDDAEKIMIASFLTAECMIIANEEVNYYYKRCMRQQKKRGYGYGKAIQDTSEGSELRSEAATEAAD